MLPAELAVLIHFNPFRVVLLVLFGHIIAALALGTSQRDFHSHYSAPPVCYFSDGIIP